MRCHRGLDMHMDADQQHINVQYQRLALLFVMGIVIQLIGKVRHLFNARNCTI
jgi:hypothetical protein